MKNHLWKKTSTYLILIGVCIGILLLVLLGITVLDKMDKAEYINDNIAEGIIFLICIPGIIVGIIGAIICTVRKK
jgi:biotin transporter BioY